MTNDDLFSSLIIYIIVSQTHKLTLFNFVAPPNLNPDIYKQGKVFLLTKKNDSIYVRRTLFFLS
jgi:hypothetical protein